MYFLYLSLFLLPTPQGESKSCFQYIDDLCNKCTIKQKGLDKGFIEDNSANVTYDKEGARSVDGKNKVKLIFKHITYYSQYLYFHTNLDNLNQNYISTSTQPYHT